MKQHKIINGRWVTRSLFQKYGFWRGRIRDLKTERVYEVSTHEREKRKAEQGLLNAIRRLEAQQEESTPLGIPFSTAYEERLSLKAVRPSTLADNQRTFKGVYKPFFGEKFVEEIEIKDIELFFKHLRTVRKVAVRTQRKYLSELRSFFQWARRRQYCSLDPTEGTKIGRAPKWHGVALTVEQARQLLRACKDKIVRTIEYSNRRKATQEFDPPEHLSAAVLIALYTGLRRGNITGLKWKHIDLAKHKISIPAEEMKANAEHLIPIHPELGGVLRKLLRGKRKVDLNKPVLGHEFHEIRKSFKSALRRANLPDIRWHDLRHTFATWVGQRAPFVVYRALLGHSPGSVSERYFHPPFEELQKVIDSLPRLLTPILATSHKDKPPQKTGQTS